jgi:NADPH2:quinone reductase
MVRTVRIAATGGPGVLTLVDAPRAELAPHEAWIEHDAIGVNYLDVMQRNGAAPLALPSGLGLEGAGVVRSVGSCVSDIVPGDRVAYILGPIGAYASGRPYPAERLIRLPSTVTCDLAAASLFKGLTAQYLLKTTYPVKADDTVLVYGAAGPLGQYLVSWAKHLGATVIGVVSRATSVDRAHGAGCNAVLVWGAVDIASEIVKLTSGKKVNVVYDGVGRDTFETSLDCLAKRGVLVSIGASSGAPRPLEVAKLNSKGSLYATRPSLAAHASDTTEYRERAIDVMNAIGEGIIKPSIWKAYPLNDVSAAHELVETGHSDGAVILKP